MGDAAGRVGARQRQNPRYRFQGQRGLARLACLVPQQAIHPLLGIAQLPAPHRWAADAYFAGHIKNGPMLGRMKDDPRPLNMLLRAVAIPNNLGQTHLVLRGDDDADGLCHDHRLAWRRSLVNPVFVSLH